MALPLKGFPNFAGASSIAIPTHAAGDMIVLWIFRDGNAAVATAPTAGGTVPTWIDIEAGSGANSCSSRLVYCIATASNHTSGTWTNGTHMVAAVLTGVAGFPDRRSRRVRHELRLTVILRRLSRRRRLSGTVRLLLYFYGIRNVSAWSTPPTGFTNGGPFASSGGVCLNTKDDLTSDGATRQVRDEHLSPVTVRRCWSSGGRSSGSVASTTHNPLRRRLSSTQSQVG